VEKIKKLKELAVPAEEASLVTDHEEREQARIKYEYLSKLIFMAKFKYPGNAFRIL